MGRRRRGVSELTSCGPVGIPFEAGVEPTVIRSIRSAGGDCVWSFRQNPEDYADQRPSFAGVVTVEPGGRGAELVELPPGSSVERMRLRLLGGRDLLLPASMSNQLVAALISLIEGCGSIVGDRRTIVSTARA